MSRSRQIQFSQWMIIIICWMIIGAIITIYDHIHLDAMETIPASYKFNHWLFYNVGAALAGGILGGAFLVFFINVRYRDQPYGFTIAAMCISFFVIVAVITLIFGVITVLETGKPFSDPEARQAFNNFVFNTYHVKNAIVWSVVVALTQLLMQINNKFGHGALWDLITGKYHRPREEKRIFMFVDLNSSTTLAEKLGNERYHILLRDFFADVTDPIINTRGEIYQYVGDEIVVAWKYEEGLENGQCINCFFEMKKQVNSNKEYYLREYGLIPTFKAGIHAGKVIAGEIGIIKRDITFSGDVLNTTSRIQSKCKEFNAEVITTGELLTELPPGITFQSRPLGTILLRGKEKELELCAVSFPGS